ncbi:phosphatase PAP2 family protein [Gynuella sunshinyii]|uniref:Membrane-associated phospholipid phosphatase n=1 Tax=Gynuella sunshinyii YC6258 TaxID=1445510 RepID=A0A0C5VZK7_9GAMM|nr:phosphatase PAP2 family protein [Gynuella sunshinyii]AJQ95859.1 membrane-associated phospholipid phosphatase [Gynuella sunshinyii YC6258]
MNKINSRYKLLAMAVAFMPIFTNCADNNTKAIVNLPAEPAGLGYEKTIAEPDVVYPLPVVDNFIAQTGKDAHGNLINKYDRAVNPVIQLLKGFDEVWSLGDAKWANGEANGSGPKDRFASTHIVDAAVWRENMSYSLRVTGSVPGYERSYQDALGAYFDDLRSKNNSLIDGLGPLAEWYKQGSGAHTLIQHNIADQYLDASNEKFFNVNEIITYEEMDSSTASVDSELGFFVKFLNIMRGPEGTTSPAKYFYCSPRPWTMDDNGNVRQTGTIRLGSGDAREEGNRKMGQRTIPVYDSHIQVVPALIYSLENRGRHKDCGFPSGHTNAGYLAAFAYAYAVPERYPELLTRAAKLGEDRIISGYHSPLDVIGGRIMATALAAAYINRYSDDADAALANTRKYFEARIRDEKSLMQYAHSESADDPFADDKANKAYYREKLAYSFKQNPAKAGQEMIVPKGAEVLLKSRFPYLTAQQRRVVLYTTGIDSGYPVLDDSNGWGRIDLVTAADGYGAFVGDVYVNMDATKGYFSAADSWDNDIHGKGKLVKSGSGKLVLTGSNSYSGGTVLNGGTLVAASSSAFGSGDVFVNAGAIIVRSKKPLVIGNHYTQINGTLSFDLRGHNQADLIVHGDMNIKAGNVLIDLETADQFKQGDTLAIIQADQIHGRFESAVTQDDRLLDIVYEDNRIVIKL